MRDSRSTASRTIFACAVAVAVVELGVAFVDLLGSGFFVQIGPLRISSSHPAKPLAAGVFALAVAWWLLPSAVLARFTNLPGWVQSAGAASLIGLNQLPLLIPLLEPGFSLGHDTQAHVTYAYLFDRALRQGQFPVRWVELIESGRSQPLFNFYQVGLYYLVEVVHCVVPSLAASLKLTVAGLWCAGGWFVFLWLKRVGWWAALTAAAVFAWAPYLLLDVFVRGAYPEFAAISLGVGLLWALDSFARDGQASVLLMVAAFSFLIIICHLPTALILSPLVASYLLFLLARGQMTANRLAAVAAAGALSVAMASFYVWPALLELNQIKIARLTTGYFDYQRHFVRPGQWLTYTWGYGGSGTGSPDQMSLQIGVAQWSFLAAGAAAAVGTLWIQSAYVADRRADVGWWLSVVGVAMFMMTSASAPIWRISPPLAFLQFPWRFLMIVAIGCAAVAAHVLSLVSNVRVRALIGLGAIFLNWQLSHAYLQEARGHPRVTMNIDDPAWGETDNARATNFAERGYDPISVVRPPMAQRGRWSVEGGGADVGPEVLKDDRVVLDVQAAHPVRIAIHSPYMPGWGISIDRRAAPFEVDAELGYLDIDVAAGRHRLEARFADTTVRRFSNVASAFGLLGWVGLAAFGVRLQSIRCIFQINRQGYPRQQRD